MKAGKHTDNRKNWNKKFIRAKKSNAPERLLPGSWGNEFDKDEWQWKSSHIDLKIRTGIKCANL